MKRIGLVLTVLMLGSMLLAQMPQHRSGSSMQMRGGSEAECSQHNQKMSTQRGTGDMGMGVWDKLDLTENQKERMKTIRHNHQLEIIDLRAEVSKLRLQVRNAQSNDDFRAAKRLTDQLYNKRAEIAKKMIDLKEQMHGILTAEQKEKLKNLPRTRGMGGDCDDCDDCK